MNLRYFLFLSFILLLMGSQLVSKKSRDGNGGDYIQQMGQQIPRWMNKYGVPGVTIALIDNGMISWSEAFGMADLDEEVLMTTKTICRVESISKSVTARGVMKLVERGSLSLDDPLVKHIHSWQFPPSDFDVHSITIRQLLAHSSGLSLGTLGNEYSPNESKPSLRESLSKEVKMVSKPGRVFNYSNTGYHLLELLIEDITGHTYSDYMREEILKPIGMTNADFEWSENFMTPVPNGHELNGKPVPVYVYSEKAAGGLFANVEDVARFVSFGMVGDYYVPENVLSEKSIHELYDPVTETAGVYSLVSEYYGLGHFIETISGGQKAVFGGGQGHGWMTHFHLLPDTGDGIVILTNSSRSWPLIANILSLWSDHNGIDSVGMELIGQAGTAFLILNIFILMLCVLITARILYGMYAGRRIFSIDLRKFSLFQYVCLFLSLILAAVLIWIHSQDYLFLTSIFPGTGEFFIFILWCITLVLLLSMLIRKSYNHTAQIVDS